MHTEMHDAKPHSVRVVSARKAVFTFDMDDSENSNLRDQQVLARSMAAFMVAYPRFESYSAEYVDKWLVLTVVGTLSPPTTDMNL